MARKERWEEHLNQVLLTKPAEIMQEACQVLEKHGCRVEEKLKSELYTARTHAHLSLCGRVLMHPFPSMCIRSAQLTAEPVHPIPALIIVGGLIHVYTVSSLLSSYTMLSEGSAHLVWTVGRVAVNTKLPYLHLFLLPSAVTVYTHTL